MVLLALDTCDSRGSVALLDDRKILGEILHPPSKEFSSWLLPAVDELLREHSLTHADLAGYAVASGPGSFTGVRVGLTTAKAWAEVYRKPIFPVSRLAVLAERAPQSAVFAAAFIDAQRKQVFAALYRRHDSSWKPLADEAVIDPTEFFNASISSAQGHNLAWISTDPVILTSSAVWNSQMASGTSIVTVEPPLASSIGLHALLDASRQETDALSLDANYVRRSDAEIFGKKAAGT